jgi:hypothetical protein
MDKHAGFFTGESPDFDEFVSKAPSCFRLTDDLLEVGIKEFVATLPMAITRRVDVSPAARGGKSTRHK